MTPLSRSGLQRLLELIEARTLIFTHAALEHFGAAGEELIRAAMVVPAGYEQAATADDDDGRPVRIDFGDRHRQLGYHLPGHGWVGVEQKMLQRFRPDLDQLFHQLLGHELRRFADGIHEIHPGLVWEIGSSYLVKNKPSTIWFARRLAEWDVASTFLSVVQKRPSADLRLILTSTPSSRLVPAVSQMANVVPIADMLSAQDAAIDFEILRARFQSQPTDAIHEPIHLSPDGRILTLNREVAIRFRGAIQQKLIRLLVDAYRKNHPIAAADLLAKAGSNADSFDQAFGKQWTELRRFLKSNGGLWRFEL